MLNNADWLMKLNYVELLREVGACFSVNNMLRAECYKQRMEKGLSFLEFNYMIMQSYDFYHMFQHRGLQHAVRRRRPVVQYAGRHRAHPPEAGQGRLCHDHHTAAQFRGQKDGQDRRPAPCGWTRRRPSPYDFYQYWRNVDDADVLKCLRMLTFLPLEQIDEMDQLGGRRSSTRAKEILAFELTKLVHGEEEAQKAQDAARASLRRRAETGQRAHHHS